MFGDQRGIDLRHQSLFQPYNRTHIRLLPPLPASLAYTCTLARRSFAEKVPECRLELLDAIAALGLATVRVNHAGVNAVCVEQEGDLSLADRAAVTVVFGPFAILVGGQPPLHIGRGQHRSMPGEQPIEGYEQAFAHAPVASL